MESFIYVITNPCLVKVQTKVPGKSGLVEPVKIGRARNVPKRLGTLNTSMTENFVDRLVVKLESERDAIVLENFVHELMEPMRIYTSDGSSTEFYAVPYQYAISEVKRIAKKLHFKLTEFHHMGYVGRSSAAIVRNHSAKKAEAKKVKQVKEESKKIASGFCFSMIGLKAGTKIKFIPSDLEVSIADDKKISYKGNEYSLSGFCKEFMPEDKRCKSNVYQGPKFFSYKGETLVDIRKKHEE